MYNGKTHSAVIVAAGKSSRFGSDKMLIKIDGISVVRRSTDAIIACGFFDEVIVVSGENRPEIEKELFGLPIAVTTGGETRFHSVLNGVNLAKGEIVSVHDGARPFVTGRVIEDTLKAMDRARISAPCMPVVETIKQVEGELVRYTPNRNNLVAVQTPQTFYREDYLKAAELENLSDVTDDCSVMELAGYTAVMTKGDVCNIKITNETDVKDRGSKTMRVGQGYDVHRLVEGRELILGGVNIPHDMGLLGHSDADVLCHAISDALLGAAALGDIGKHFPDTDAKYLGANSIELLCEVAKLIKAKGYIINNIDSTVIAQQPKLSPHIPNMIKNIAEAVGVSEDQVSVKATTEEGLGFTGNKEGIAATSVVCISV